MYTDLVKAANGLPQTPADPGECTANRPSKQQVFYVPILHLSA